MALESTAEVRHVLDLARPGFVSLVQVVERLGDSPAEHALRDEIIRLDQRIRARRTFHTVQLAGRKDPGYLPPDALGSGGTSGFPYLAVQRPPRASRVPGPSKITKHRQPAPGNCDFSIH